MAELDRHGPRPLAGPQARLRLGREGLLLRVPGITNDPSRGLEDRMGDVMNQMNHVNQLNHMVHRDFPYIFTYHIDLGEPDGFVGSVGSVGSKGYR